MSNFINPYRPPYGANNQFINRFRPPHEQNDQYDHIKGRPDPTTPDPTTLSHYDPNSEPAGPPRNNPNYYIKSYDPNSEPAGPPRNNPYYYKRNP